MPERLSFKEALARQAEIPVERLAPSGSRIALLLTMPNEIPLPVTTIETIASFGASLRKANETLNRIARGETVAIELVSPAGRDIVAELSELGVGVQVLERPRVDVRAIRQHLDLTQFEFAIRFGLELDTIQNWEQGRYSPDPTATVLLKVIEQNPEAVDAALAAS